MSRRRFMGFLGGTAAAGGLSLLRPSWANAAPATSRPISDFLDAQGSTSIFFPLFPDYVGWSTPLAKVPIHFALVDYAGLVDGPDFFDGALGTTTGGSINERPLEDGRAEVRVTLHTKNALAWANEIDPDFDTAKHPPLFGYRAAELDADPTLVPGLAGSHLEVVFKNTAPGDPLPDLVVAFIFGEGEPEQELISLAFRADAKGPLREEFGVPEGTPGQCVVSQTGVLFLAKFMGATGDGFPAEYVNIRQTG